MVMMMATMRKRMMTMMRKKPEVDDEEKLESGGEVGKGGVDRVSHLSWVLVWEFELVVWEFCV